MTELRKIAPRLRRGFTIVELLMVIGIISVLITITVSAVSGSMKKARSVRTSALCTLVQQGIATYYAQKGEWPVEPGEPTRSDGDDNGYYTFTGSEVQKMIRMVVNETKQNNPMMDVSGLFVSTSTGEPGTNGRGMDFLSAIHGTPQHKRQIKLNQMYFGYPDKDTGVFRRFKVVYNSALDSVIVSTQTAK